MSNATFTAGGRAWLAGFTDDTEAAARNSPEFAADLAALAELRPARLVERLNENPGVLGSLLYLACRGACEARGLTPEAFAAQFNYANLPAAAVALMGAIAERYPRSRLAAGLKRYRKAR